MKILNRFLLSTFDRFGFQVVRKSAIPAIRKAQHEAAALEQWRFLTRYDAKTILDIGANVGQFAEIARHWNKDGLIVSFEPLADCADEVEKQSEQLAPHRLVRSALGSEDGTTEINRNESTPSSSLLPMENLHHEELPHTAKSTVETIRVQRLDSVFQEPPEGPTFIKIDVQGFEREVLAGGQQVLRDAVAVVIEVSLKPLYTGAPTFDELYSEMKRMGFKYSGNVDQWISGKDGQILQCDCLFEK